MDLIITAGELIISDKGKEVERVQVTPESIDDELKLARKKYPGSNIRVLPIKKIEGLVHKKKDEYLAQLKEFATRLTSARISRTVERDELILQSINAIDDLNKQINSLVTRLREWYGLIDPISTRSIDDHEKLVKKITTSFTKELFGLEIEENDKQIIIAFAESITRLYKLKDKLEKYIDKIMSEIAPNTRLIAGSVIGARLIAKAGGLKKLAMMPGSTIQVLGAEKALFRHLIRGSPSPKHGLIFQHPLLSSKPKQLRGRIARSLAAKISIAARMDYYGHGLDESLAEDLNKRVEGIK